MLCFYHCSKMIVCVSLNLSAVVYDGMVHLSLQQYSCTYRPLEGAYWITYCGTVTLPVICHNSTACFHFPTHIIHLLHVSSSHPFFIYPSLAPPMWSGCSDLYLSGMDESQVQFKCPNYSPELWCPALGRLCGMLMNAGTEQHNH